jgi:transcriptional regulator with XRE-family HTH domain
MKSGRERLKDWIDRSRCSQNEAAEILGITAPYLSQLLSGVRTPGLANAIKFEQITGIAAGSWLLTDVSQDDAAPAVDCENRQ